MTACEPFVADCRVRAALDLLAHQWDPVVLMALRPAPRRRIALRDDIGGISDKVLTESLARLSAAGLVARTSYAEAPPRADYGLTALGVSLVDGPLQALGAWVEAYGEELG